MRVNDWIMFVCLICCDGPVAGQQCQDMPGTMRQHNITEAAAIGEILFEFAMEMSDVTLTLEPLSQSPPGYMEIELGDVLPNNKQRILVTLNNSLDLNVLNQDLIPARIPATDEALSCNYTHSPSPPMGEPTNEVKYELKCSHVDGNSPPGVTFFVFIQEVNDHEPVFYCDPYVKHITEMTPVGSTVFTLQGLAYDPDIEGGIMAFDIMRFDYDHGPREITVNVSAEDSALDSLVTWTSLTFIIEDADDQVPAFSQLTYDLRVSEENSTLIGQPLTTNPALFAYDLDFGINASIHYRLTEGCCPEFDIRQTTGELVPLQVFDREAKDSYTVHVQAYQEDEPLTRFTSSIVDVSINDVNDNAPVMSQEVYHVSIPEHLPNGTVILQVYATDRDAGENAVHEFICTDTCIDHVNIESDTGILKINNSVTLDREVNELLVIQVYSIETLTPEALRSNLSLVYIHLTDINDNNPVLYDTGPFYVPLELAAGFPIGQVKASDRDEGNNALIRYSIDSALSEPVTLDIVDIDASTGWLYTKAEVMMENTTAVYVVIQAVDSPDLPQQPRMDYGTVHIIFSDLPPPTAPSSTESSIGEITSQEITSQGITSQGITSQDDCTCTEITIPDAVGVVTEPPTDVFVVAVSALSVLLLIFILLIILLLVWQYRKGKHRRVDRGTEPCFTGTITPDTLSLITNEENIGHSLPTVFSQLDEESSTERSTIHRHYKGKNLRAPLHGITSKAKLVDTATNTELDTPITTQSPISTPSMKEQEIFIQFDEAPAQDCLSSNQFLPTQGTNLLTPDEIEKATNNIIQTGQVVGSCNEKQATKTSHANHIPQDLEEKDLNNISVASHPTENVEERPRSYTKEVGNILVPGYIDSTEVPKLNLDLLNDLKKEEVLQKDVYPYCRVEETIDIDIPCDSPRSYQSDRNSNSESNQPGTYSDKTQSESTRSETQEVEKSPNQQEAVFPQNEQGIQEQGNSDQLPKRPPRKTSKARSMSKGKKMDEATGMTLSADGKVLHEDKDDFPDPSTDKENIDGKNIHNISEQNLMMRSNLSRSKHVPKLNLMSDYEDYDVDTPTQDKEAGQRNSLPDIIDGSSVCEPTNNSNFESEQGNDLEVTENKHKPDDTEKLGKETCMSGSDYEKIYKTEENCIQTENDDNFSGNEDEKATDETGSVDPGITFLDKVLADEDARDLNNTWHGNTEIPNYEEEEMKTSLPSKTWNGSDNLFTKNALKSRMKNPPNGDLYTRIDMSKKKERKSIAGVNPNPNAAPIKPDYGTVNSTSSIESTVKVINELPDEQSNQDNSELYVDHTFFTSGGPITFL